MTTKSNHRSVDAIEATKNIWNKMTFGGLVRSLRSFFNFHYVVKTLTF